MEICIESSNFGSGLVVALRPPFQRFNSSLRRGGSSRSARRPASLLAPPDVVIQCEDNGIQNSKQTETVASWATAFEKLLADPIGLQAFAEFLKKEFSAENIYFWTSCERYRRLPAGPEKVAEAQRIYKHHLCVGAPEAVNVDSQVRQFTEQSLLEANSSLFEQTQKQIFNLMKFDSYPRFLKSELYKQCLAGHIETSVDDGLLLQPATATPGKLKKSLSNAEDRWRKSLLPWHRKNRSKSKDRGEIDYSSKKDDGNESAIDEVGKSEGNDVHSSKSSLTSQESSRGLPDDSAVARGPLCRVILSNGSTTVVKIKDNETVEQMVNHVLEKRGISYSSFEVFTDKHAKAVNIGDASMVLAGCEVRVERRVIFKLDLPNRKVIAVKSKATKILVDVLKPILNKYDYRLEQVNVVIGSSNKVDISQPVTSIDGMRLIIQINNDWKDKPSGHAEKLLNVKVFNATSLDEITNKVFKELLQEKGESKYKSGSERGSIKSEDWGSEHSSGLLGRFLRRDSGIHNKKKHSAHVKNPSNHSSIEDITNENSSVNTKKPLIAKWKTGVNKLHVGCSESEKLYEGLNRAQNSRIEDQRGTEINFELPDFLKDKEAGQHNCNRVRKFRRTESSNSDTSRYYDVDATILHKQEQINSSNATRNLKAEAQCNYENRNIIFGLDRSIVNNNNLNQFNQNTELNNIRRYPPSSRSSDESAQSTPTKCNKFNNKGLDSLSKTIVEMQDSPKVGDPPPLPPKPKILPIKPSNWGQSGLFKVPRVPRSDGTKQSLYLEHPTSSFV